MKRVWLLATSLAEYILSQRIANRPDGAEDPARRVPCGFGQRGVPVAGGDEDGRGRRTVRQQQPAGQGGDGQLMGRGGQGQTAWRSRQALCSRRRLKEKPGDEDAVP